MTAIPPITMLGASIRWRALDRSARALRIFWLGRFAMGLMETTDVTPPLPRQLVVAAASFICRGRPAVHFTKEVHQCQGILDGCGDIGSRLAAFFALSLLDDPPSRH